MKTVTEQIDDATADMHGSFVWSCNHEHGDDRYKDPIYNCTTVIVAGTDQNDGTHAYGLGDIQDMIVNPDQYDEKVELHGTHELTDEQLNELSCGGEIFMGRGPDGNLPDGVKLLDAPVEIGWGANDDSEFVVCGVNFENELVVISTLAFHEYAKFPTQIAADGVAKLYGTHVLPESTLDMLFGDDEV